jgi:carbohydrate-selective porin OprB
MGIPEDAALHIDVAGMRKALAASGIGIGGFYAAETFGNPSGGFKQGATYDGVLELHLDGDLKKWGLWKASACTPMAIRSTDEASAPTTSTV